MSRLAFELLLGQVLEALPPAPASVVDAGGGTGQLAVALAGRGYRVTVVDTSAAMLATCAQRAADAGPEVAERVTGVQGDAADLPGLLGDHAAALRLVRAGGSGPPVGGEAMTLGEAEAELHKAGFDLVTAAGVGVFTDIGDDDPGPREVAALVELERLVAGREPYRSSARTLHLVARRRVFRPDLSGDRL